MTINECFEKLRPRLKDEEIVEIFICVNDWANTPKGALLAECHGIENFNCFFERYGELKTLNLRVIISDYYGGFGVGFVVASADL